VLRYHGFSICGSTQNVEL